MFSKTQQTIQVQMLSNYVFNVKLISNLKLLYVSISPVLLKEVGRGELLRHQLR